MGLPKILGSMRTLYRQWGKLLDHHQRIRVALDLLIKSLPFTVVIGAVIWGAFRGWLDRLPIVLRWAVVVSCALILMYWVCKLILWVRQKINEKQEPVLSMTPRFADGNLYLILRNRKTTDQFKATLTRAPYAVPEAAVPLVLRWKDRMDEYRKIDATGTDVIHLLRYEFVSGSSDRPDWNHVVLSSLTPHEFSIVTDLFPWSKPHEYECGFGFHITVIGENTEVVEFVVSLNAVWFPREGTGHSYRWRVEATVEPSPFSGRFPNRAFTSALYEDLVMLPGKRED